jgi:DNA-directed RNA polymerase III subunit RPC1
MDEKARRSFLKRIRNKNIDGVQRSEILKSINVACKKVTVCPHCEGINGAVKKVGAMKIIHEKFKRKKKSEEEEFFRQSFSLAVEMDPGMKTHVSKAQEDLNPIKVIRMFQQISNEDCELMGLDPINGRPELFIW